MSSKPAPFEDRSTKTKRSPIKQLTGPRAPTVLREDRTRSQTKTDSEDSTIPDAVPIKVPVKTKTSTQTRKGSDSEIVVANK